MFYIFFIIFLYFISFLFRNRPTKSRKNCSKLLFYHLGEFICKYFFKIFIFFITFWTTSLKNCALCKVQIIWLKVKAGFVKRPLSKTELYQLFVNLVLNKNGKKIVLSFDSAHLSNNARFYFARNLFCYNWDTTPIYTPAMLKEWGRRSIRAEKRRKKRPSWFLWHQKRQNVVRNLRVHRGPSKCRKFL